MRWISIEWYVYNCLARVVWVGFLTQMLTRCTALAIHLNTLNLNGKGVAWFDKSHLFPVGFYWYWLSKGY